MLVRHILREEYESEKQHFLLNAFYSTALATPVHSNLSLQVLACSTSLFMPTQGLVWAFFLGIRLVGPGHTITMACAPLFLTMVIPKYSSLS